MTRVRGYFSDSYLDARETFLDAARRAKGDLTSFMNPNATGVEDEGLATDLARFGPADAENVLIVNSGTHGVEGYCGSGCQVGAIQSGLIRERARNTAIVLCHAINPYGFSWSRRGNEDNVDLNRNFVDHEAGHPDNPAYREVHGFIAPADWAGPGRAAADKAMEAFIAERGEVAFQAAVTGGQYEFPKGLFYGGQAPVWSNVTFREVVRRAGRGRRRIALIDLHTGLGPSGHGELIYSGAESEPGYHRATAWFGEAHSTKAGRSVSAVVMGDITEAVPSELPEAEYTAVALEFGTVPMLQVLDALRADNWLYAYGDPKSSLGKQIRAQTRAAFYVDDDTWKSQVFTRASEVIRQALSALGA